VQSATYGHGNYWKGLVDTEAENAIEITLENIFISLHVSIKAIYNTFMKFGINSW
jgi:hypothetical protein